MTSRISSRARVAAIPALLAAGAVAALPAGLRPALAQSSPEAPSQLADLGLPELNINLTADAIEGVPDSLDAGRYLLTIGGEAGPDDFALATIIMQLPEGVPVDDAVAQIGDGSEGLPEFFYEAVFAGGKSALVAAGETSASSVIDLTPGPGQWVVLDTTFARPPVPFTVNGEMPSDLPEPESNATILMGEMYFELSEGTLVAGENLVKIVNEGAQPHFVEVMGVPEGTTNANITAMIDSQMGATPSADPLDLSQAVPVAYIGEQSTGVTVWAPLTLEAGTYAVLCWITDPETGMPHAMMGMHDVYVVE